MENPATWGPIEKTIHRVIQEHEETRARKMVGGYSLEAKIAHALRDAGLTTES